LYGIRINDVTRTKYLKLIDLNIVQQSNLLALEKQPANNIYERLVNVYADSAPSYSTVTRWVAEFKRGRTSLEDDTLLDG